MRERVGINAIGERLSLKIQNNQNVYWQIEDIGIDIDTLDRRRSEMINVVSHHVSFKIAGSGIVSSEAVTTEEFLTTEDGDTLITESGDALLVLARTTESGEGVRVGLDYIKILGTVYENQ